MDVISVKPNNQFPGVLLEKKSGTFQIYGNSFPEDAVDFYVPICKWFDEYKKNPLPTTVLDFKLLYFNTISAKYFLNIMGIMELIQESGHEAKIRWYYNEKDQDAKEAGEEFDGIIDIDFELIPYEDVYEEESDSLIDDLINTI